MPTSQKFVLIQKSTNKVKSRRKTSEEHVIDVRFENIVQDDVIKEQPSSLFSKGEKSEYSTQSEKGSILMA